MVEAMLGTGQKVHSLLLDDASDDDMNFLSHVEMAICTSARVFIRTVGSTWSYNVMSMRGETDGSGSSSEVTDVSTATDSPVSESKEPSEASTEAQASEAEASEAKSKEAKKKGKAK